MKEIGIVYEIIKQRHINKKKSFVKKTTEFNQ